MKGCYTLILLFLFSLPSSYAQKLKGYIYDKASQEELTGVNVFYKDKDGVHGTVTDMNGYYELAVPDGSVTVSFSYLGYETLVYPLVFTREQEQRLNVFLSVESQLMDEVVVSVGRYEQKLSDVTVSMELLKAGDIIRQSPADLTGALKTIPGVEVNDRQPSIRSGSGWTYGVGSRAMIMVDGISVLTPGSGEINWNVVPLENIDQIEVLKGASSVLYGSSALNGLIHIRTKRPSLEPVTRIKTYLGIYGNPAESSYQWWSTDFWKEGKYPVTPAGRRNVFSGIRNPIYNGIDLSHSRRIGNIDVTAGGNYFTDEGYRSGNYTNRFRLGGNLTYHDQKIQGLNYGFNTNFLSNDYAGFFIWRSPEEAYMQSPLASLGRQGNQFYVDPFLNYTSDENKSGHKLKGRYYRQSNQIVSKTTDKSIIDIANTMGFQYAKLPEVIDLAQNWQTKLLPRFLPYLPDVLNGNYSGIAGEVLQLSNTYFPNAKPADYIDLISWFMGRSPIPATQEELIPWFVESQEGQKHEDAPHDYTTSYMMDYQYSKGFENSQLTAGITYEHVYADSKVTGNHTSDNAALFAQYDHKLFDRLNLSAGFRMEYYRVDEHYREAETNLSGVSLPFKPVFRGGLNYELAEYSFIRASFGQGYRYPSVTEKFVLKDIGGVGAFPNAELKAEYGYNAELGFKQGYQIGGLKGFIDLAGFYTRYNDLIEFRIGLFDKKTFRYISGLNDLINSFGNGNGLGIGAQFHNMGRAQIYGADVSVTGLYEFNPETRLTFNFGYVFTEPRDMDVEERNAEEEANTDLLAMRSKSNDSKYLKYRQKHNIKGLFDFEWKRYSIGANLAWKSRNLAVDYFFVDEREKTNPNLMDYVRYVLFGNLHDYWKENNKGYFMMDLRMGAKATGNVSFQAIINNLLNTEYSNRPMDVSAPRTFVIQMAVDF